MSTMPQFGSPPEDEHSLGLWVDRIADAFERQWKTGGRPAMVDYLDDTKDRSRRLLLTALAAVDIDYRGGLGESPQLEDYLREFPELAGEDGRVDDELLVQLQRVRRPAAASDDSPTAPHAGEGKRAPAPPKTLGRFQLLELLGEGAFGCVYKARDPQLQRTVAIKVPRSGVLPSDRDVQRFLREARSAARLRHPGVIQVHEIEQVGDSAFIVSDYIQGCTLSDYFQREPIAPRQAAELVSRIADALHYAHGQNVIHRDVKPNNILIDDEGAPHITDFGLALEPGREAALTAEGQVLGSPGYMSPEQAAGQSHHVDHRSDVYSAGVVLYELLTGERPFRGNVRMLLHQVIHEEPRPPRSLNDGVPRDLETICLKAMAKEPARRYASAADLAADLRRFLNDEPILARPVSWMERLWRWRRRNPAVAALSATIAGLLIVVAVAATVSAVRFANLAEDEHQARSSLAESLSRSQAQQGVLRLEEGDASGLVDLADAWKTAGDNEQERASRARLWSSWYAAVRGRLITVLRHDHAVNHAAVSPDGKRIAIGAADGTARIFDAKTGRPVSPLLKHEPPESLPQANVLNVKFSPDGKLLAVSGYHGVKLWDAGTAQPSRHVLASHGKLNWPVAFSADGRWITVGLNDNRRLLYDAVNQKQTTITVPPGLATAAFSADGAWLALGAHGGFVQLWSTATGRQHGEDLLHDPSQREPQVDAVAFSRDGRFLASGARDQTARLWNTSTGELVHKFEHDEDVKTVGFSPDGRYLATGSFDGAVWLWRLGGRPIGGRRLHHQGPVLALAFSPDSRTLATSGFDGIIRLWDTAGGNLLRQDLRHADVVTALAFFPQDNDRLLSSSRDGTARVWDLSPYPEPIARVRHEGRVWHVRFTPDGATMASLSYNDGRIQFTDARTKAPARGPFQRPELYVRFAFSPDGRLLAAAENGQEPMEVRDLATGKVTANLHCPIGGQIRSLQFHPRHAHLLAVASADSKTAVLWDLRQRPPRPHQLQHTRLLSCLALHPRKLLAAGGGPDGDVRLWEGESWRPAAQVLQHTRSVETLAFNRDGKLLAVASASVQCWDTRTWRPYGKPIRHRSVQAVAFSPGGLLATASSDGTARLWDTETGLPCGPAFPHGAFVASVDFSPDGSLMATGSFDNYARLWRLPRIHDDAKQAWLDEHTRQAVHGSVK